MLAGRRAFEGASAVETLNAILKEEPPEIAESKGEVSPALFRVVRHCLEKNREERFQSMADVAFYLETLTTDAERHTSAARTVQPQRRRYWLMISVAALVLAAGAVAITIWQLRRSKAVWENPLANAHIERVTDFQGTENDVAISPDGKFIVFLSDREGIVDAWVNQIGSGAFVNLTKGRFPELARRRKNCLSRVWARRSDICGCPRRQ